MSGEKNLITEPKTYTQFMNCILLTDVATLLQQLLFLHVYTRGRLVIALTALTSVIKNQSWRGGRGPTGFLLYTCKGERPLALLSFLLWSLRCWHDLAKASIGSISFIFWYLVCLPLGLSETGFDHSWTPSFKKKCTSADQPFAPPVSCQFFSLVLSKN